MKKSQIFIIIGSCLVLIATNAARGQVGMKKPTNGDVILYRLEEPHGKYVLSTSFESSEKAKASLVVIGDTFSVQPQNGMCAVVMSNAYILQTSFGTSPSNQVRQIKFRTDAWMQVFPNSTKLIFNSSVVELPTAKIGASSEANKKTYEGEEALRQMKKMGWQLPDDMDTKKAAGHQK